MILLPSLRTSFADELARETSCHHIDGATLGCKVDQVHGADLANVLRQPFVEPLDSRSREQVWMEGVLLGHHSTSHDVDI